MPSWFDYLNPNNADQNKEIAEEIKSGEATQPSTNQSSTNAVNTNPDTSPSSSNTYNPTENRFTAVNPDNAQNNVNWANSQNSQSSQQQAIDARNRELQEQREREIQEQQREKDIQEQRERQNQEQREIQERREREIQEQREREASTQSESETNEIDRNTVEPRNEHGPDNWSDEDRSIASDILEKKEDLKENSEGSFSLSVGGEEMILPEILPRTGNSGASGSWDSGASGSWDLPMELIAGTFAKKVYNDEPLFWWQKAKWSEMPDGWAKSPVTTDGGNGYYAEYYYNLNTKEIVVAHKGSNFSLDVGDHDWFGNLESYVLGKDHYQVSNGLKVHDDVAEQLGEEWQIIHAGHSLGGHIAEVVASKKGTIAFSFDPLYSNEHDSYDGIWRYAPPNGVHDITSNRKLPNYHTKNVHPLDNLLDRLNKQISENRDDHINPIATSIINKSEILRGVFYDIN